MNRHRAAIDRVTPEPGDPLNDPVWAAKEREIDEMAMYGPPVDVETVEKIKIGLPKIGLPPKPWPGED
jgi:hypothetical protein